MTINKVKTLIYIITADRGSAIKKVKAKRGDGDKVRGTFPEEIQRKPSWMRPADHQTSFPLPTISKEAGLKLTCVTSLLQNLPACVKPILQIWGINQAFGGFHFPLQCQPFFPLRKLCCWQRIEDLCESAVCLPHIPRDDTLHRGGRLSAPPTFWDPLKFGGHWRNMQ